MHYPHRDEVFVAGGQPTITYVDRKDQDVERLLARAIAAPNQIVSLSGPTKTGKTVLCKKTLSNREYVWVDGGKIKTSEDFWKIVSSELNIPSETALSEKTETSLSGEGSIPFLTASGSRLSARENALNFRVDTMGRALEQMTSQKIILVIDDFHYIPSENRVDIMRNIKGTVFNGLKVLLLSVTHRVFDAIKAEPELTGRFIAISLPHWNKDELKQIPTKGFEALGTTCSPQFIENLCEESQESPFLMQRFCWEICFDLNIEKKSLLKSHEIPASYHLNNKYMSLAEDAGLPIYKRLAAGPQSRRTREKRLLKEGGEVDIYEATLRAIAETGPQSTIKYDELRDVIARLLVSNAMPQKHEITSALKQLTKISRDIGAESAIDWNEDTREITVADPYLRFYLRWKIRKNV